jgi:hypothetical protein
MPPHADNDVRRAVGESSLALAQKYPDSAGSIVTKLVSACGDPALDIPDGIERGPGWDYAYHALRPIIGLVDT